jgi:hypothetical protein
MDAFLETTSESMFGYEGSSEEELVSDRDIEKMLEEEVAHEERKGIDDQIDKDIADIEEELNKEQK